MSVAKSPFRQAAAASGSAGASAGAAKGLTSEELSDALALSFLGLPQLSLLKSFLKQSQAAEAVPINNFKKIVAFAVKHIEQGSLPEETRSKLYADESMLSVFQFCLRVLECAIRAHTKEATFSTDLTKLGIKADYVNELAAAYKARRETMTDTAQQDRVALPTITNVRWRVDVAISTTSLSRVFKPTIPLQLTLSDGTIHNFECSVEKFHELRYAVAKSLKHAQDLQSHPTLTREME